MKRHAQFVLLVALLWLSAPVRAEEKVTPAAPAEVREFKADDLEGLRAAINADIALRGVVDHVGTTKAKNLVFLNFHSDYRKTANISLSTKGGDADTLKTELETAYKGKDVRAKGKLVEFKGRLELKVSGKDSIEVIAPTP